MVELLAILLYPGKAPWRPREVPGAWSHKVETLSEDNLDEGVEPV